MGFAGIYSFSFFNAGTMPLLTEAMSTMLLPNAGRLLATYSAPKPEVVISTVPFNLNPPNPYVFEVSCLLDMVRDICSLSTE